MEASDSHPFTPSPLHPLTPAIPDLPPSWHSVVGDETGKPYFRELAAFLADETAAGQVFPPASEIFAALEMTPFDRVSVVLLGQDPYPTPGHAHGLCFSVRPGVAPPRSLVNIFRELKADLGINPPASGCLEAWARQGVLLLNTCLTVRSGEPLSHRCRGWETFTDAVIRAVNAGRDGVVFVLWGKPAQAKTKLIDANRHAVVTAAHPSPLSANAGFFGSKPFSRTNEALARFGKRPIDWQL